MFNTCSGVVPKTTSSGRGNAPLPRDISSYESENGVGTPFCLTRAPLEYSAERARWGGGRFCPPA